MATTFSLPDVVSEHPIAFALPSFLILLILFNVLQQLAFQTPSEPPVVFHWLPIIGSTVTYGIDPFKFFFDCQAKVRRWALSPSNSTDSRRPREVWQYLYLRSTGQEGHRLSWAKRKSIHSKWKTEGRQCGGDLLSSHDSMLWEGCYLRLP